jgi:hypothetical protein
LGRPATPEEIRSLLRRGGAFLTEQFGVVEKLTISLAKFDGSYIETTYAAVMRDLHSLVHDLRERGIHLKATGDDLCPKLDCHIW